MPGVDAYRAPPRDALAKAPRSELVFAPTHRDTGHGLVSYYKVVSLPLLFIFAVTSVAAMTTNENVAAATFLVACVGCYVYRRRARDRDRTILRVEDGALEVRTERGDARRFTLPDVLDVVLDTKTVTRMLEGSSMIPAVRFMETSVGPEIDTSRIALVLAGPPERLDLTSEYLPHMDATEWVGKIRVFLREHGWKPEDERDDEL
jgi:hypothetical protein